MSLLNLIQNNIAAKSVTVSTFRTDSEDYLLREGYSSIHRQLYGAMGIDRAFMLSAFFAGVKLLSEDVGSVPLLTFREDGKEAEVEDQNHPLYKLLKYSPNPDMTAMQFRETLTAHAITSGIGYARKEYSRGDSERIIAMWPLMPYEVQRVKDSRGRIAFRHMPQGGPEKTYESRQIFRLSGFGMTGYDGLNLMELARDVLGLGLMQQEYALRFFSQDQTPNLVLKFPNKLGPTGVEGAKRAWVGADTGKSVEDKWHAPKVIQEGGDVVQLHPDNQKSQLTEQRAQQILEIARLLRLPPHKLGELGRATWANIGDENQSYYTGSLRLHFTRWEQSLKLYCYGIDSTNFAKHDTEDLVRGDYKTVTEGIAKLSEKGILNINEARRILHYNPIKGGDEHFIQLNMGTLDNVANPEPSPQRVRVGGDDDASEV